MNKGGGYCGLVCEMCKDDKNCIGCHQGGCKDKENCKNYVCCQNKHYQGCYECPLFPCQDSILHKLRIRTFCRFIQKYGEKELISCLKNNEKAGIYYHKDHRHYGDYDVFDHEQDIIDLLLQGRVYIRECQLKDHQDIYELNKNELSYDHSLSLTKKSCKSCLQAVLIKYLSRLFMIVLLAMFMPVIMMSFIWIILKTSWVLQFAKIISIRVLAENFCMLLKNGQEKRMQLGSDWFQEKPEQKHISFIRYVDTLQIKN